MVQYVLGTPTLLVMLESQGPTYGCSLELTVWLLPSLWENIIAISLVGFFMGPIYPTCIMMLSRNVAPRHV